MSDTASLAKNQVPRGMVAFATVVVDGDVVTVVVVDGGTFVALTKKVAGSSWQSGLVPVTENE